MSGRTDFDDQTITRDGGPSPLVGSRERRARVVILAGPESGQVFTLENGNNSVGRSDEAHIRVTDDGVSRSHCDIELAEGSAKLVDLNSRNGTFVNDGRIETVELNDGDRIKIGHSTILKFVYQDEIEHEFHSKLVESALRDPLTSLFNKRYFQQCLQAEFRFALRHEQSLSLLLLDLDHFKSINDKYGHLVGDDVLKAFSALVQRVVRTEDTLARYGGEEFAVILRSTTPADGGLLAERIRKSVEELTVPVGSAELRATVSIGVAGIPDGRIPDELMLIRAADAALYRAKNAGRNRVSVFIGEQLSAEPQPIGVKETARIARPRTLLLDHEPDPGDSGDDS